MGRVYRQIVTRPLPEGATVSGRGQRRSAHWTDRRGRKRTAKVTSGRVDGPPRIISQARTYMAEYRDGQGELQTVATGCRDKGAALARLAELERRAELVRAGVLSIADDQISKHARTPIAKHIHAFMAHMTSKGDGLEHRDATLNYLEVLADVCAWKRLGDLRREPLEQWLAIEADKGRSARTRNAHLTAAVSFANWCISTRRLAANPFARMPKVSEKADRRRQRRALFAEEMINLLVIARLRPLAEIGREPQEISTAPAAGEKPKRARWRWSELTLATIGEAAARGREKLARHPSRLAALEEKGYGRAVVYKALVLTGLRMGELSSITVGRAYLDAPLPYLVLEPKDEKNREGSQIPVPPDLEGELRTWMGLRLRRLQEKARVRGEPIPMRLPADLPLLDIPAGLLRIMNRDLVAAGLARWAKHPKTGKPYIDKRDERGRTIDVHALRTTFGTLLSQAGVPLRTAQEAMRHSDPRLTANVYTDPKLLDVAGATNLLPALPIGTVPPSSVTGIVTAATGTGWHDLTQSVQGGVDGHNGRRQERPSISASDGTGKPDMAQADTACPDNPAIRGDRIRTCDLLTPSQRDEPTSSEKQQGLTIPGNDSYRECYGSPGHSDVSAMDGLAETLLALPPDQRQRLLALLSQENRDTHPPATPDDSPPTGPPS